MAEAQTQSPASGSDLSGLLMQQLAGQSASSSALQKSLGESAAMKRGVAEKLLAERPPPAPVMSPPPAPAPTPAEHSPLEAFGSLAAGLAILGSFKSRAPFTAALKAGAAAMNGVKQRDAEAFKRNYEIWKQQSEYAAQLEKWQNDRYKAAMEEYSGDQNKMLSVLQVMSAADKDDIAANSIRTGDIRNLENLIQHRDQMLQQFQMSKMRIDIEGMRLQAEIERLKGGTGAAGIENRLFQDWKQKFTADNKREPNTDEQIAELTKIRGTKPASTGSGAENEIFATWKKNWIAEHAGQPPTAAEEAAALKQIKLTDKPPTGAQIKDEEKAGSVNALLDYSDETLTGLNQLVDGVGASGHIVRPVETLGNILGLTDATSAHRFETQITTLRNMGLRLLNDRSILNAHDREDAEKMIRGLELGSTVQNVTDSIQGLQKLLFGKYRDSLVRNGYLAGNKAAPEDRGKGKYHVGQELTIGGKKYRVTGGDMNDPDVEPIP